MEEKSCSKLHELMQILRENIDKPILYKYAIPDLWNTWNYSGNELIVKEDGELYVNPFKFYYEVISSYVKNDQDNKHDNFKYSDFSYSGGDWIKNSVVYSMMIRTSTAWDHNQNGVLEIRNSNGLKETGTFIKSLALLPLLKKMGVDVLYLLPISKYSLKNKKGDLGSPYSISNFFEIDPNLKDPLTGDSFSVEDEFAAFIEACHSINIKVIIDFIPRTQAVDNDLVMEHPEWFYWIKCDEYENYAPPIVPDLGDIVAPTPNVLSKIYQSEEVRRHIFKFSHNPRKLSKESYDKLINIYKEDDTLSFLDLVKKEFNIQIAPAFSDHINDPQPPWTDITFFRLYEDHPIKSQGELRQYFKNVEDIPPYILFDIIKCNYYQGNKPNKLLWETLSEVIPFYQKKFGIDGARVDMGHALPTNLLELIIHKARSINPDFCFIAEELDTSNAKGAKQLGYNMIIGDSFFHEARIKEGKLKGFISHIIQNPCPIFACGETHDTPRLASREGGIVLSNMLTVLNMFIPNSIPFINSGQEVYEKQPINTGLDVEPNSLYMLDNNDPYYMKLALFDKYAFHYLNEDRWFIPKVLEKVTNIRKKYVQTITNLDNYMSIDFIDKETKCIGLSYIEGSNVLFIFANIDCYKSTKAIASISKIRKKINSYAQEIFLLFSLYENSKKPIVTQDTIKIQLYPGEVQIVKL